MVCTIVQDVAAYGYGYVSPTLDKARTKVSLFDSTVKRVETIIPQVICKADDVLGAAYVVVSSARRPPQGESRGSWTRAPS